MRHHLLLLLGALVVGGCVHERYVLLPNEAGQVGSLAVNTAAGKTVTLDKPYEMASASAFAVDTKTSSAEEVQSMFGDSLAARPAPPKKFTLHFLEGTDELTPASRAEVDGIFAEIARRPVPDVIVVGHTDRVGSLGDNDRLALLRANKVAADLVRLGLPSDSVRATGRGEREPLKQTADEVDEPLNRRVEIYVR